MSTGRPASLDGALLARKGDAAPAISNHSPLLEELGEPRTEQPGGPYGTGPVPGGGRAGLSGLVARGLAWSAQNPIYGVLGIALGIAILFAVTIIALTPGQEADSPAAPSEPQMSASEPEKIDIPDGVPPSTEPADPDLDAVAATAKREASPAEAVRPEIPPAPPVAAAPAPAPSAANAAKSAPKPAVSAKPAVPSKPVAAAPANGKTGRYLLQLSAVPSAKAARTELARLSKRLGGVLGNRKLIVVKAVPRGKLPVYRLRASSYDTRSAARAACRQIRKKKMACIVIRR